MTMLAALLLATIAPDTPATLIVYRAYAEPILFAPTLIIDDRPYGSLGQHRLRAFAVSPGPHKISVVWPAFSSQRRTTLDLSLRPGARRFVELRAASGYGRSLGISRLIEQDDATGAAAIACCRPAQ